ncbi:hypothetical protein A2Z61_00860 [Candidatus Campbellbacteria bacterium RIFCSPLOWO2_02_35_12]|uniref:Uncharacterized protein n=1 Tax=Candidatus Campbellbacteria bacterium RIFCSPLOWO2_02_35_12 TaxID=1797580 RepID=A0A1F5EJH9_9BACT|nr:MAG: hypothetical protein A2Z61_00860 [Candidatus Campbellbacteria bacterium RIFCSPLOWO2_02_35_12]
MVPDPFFEFFDFFPFLLFLFRAAERGQGLVCILRSVKLTEVAPPSYNFYIVLMLWIKISFT